LDQGQPTQEVQSFIIQGVLAQLEINRVDCMAQVAVAVAAQPQAAMELRQQTRLEELEEQQA
jgi:hypothetical protein